MTDVERRKPSHRIPTAMKRAVVVAEDATFYQHGGIDVKAIKIGIQKKVDGSLWAKVEVPHRAFPGLKGWRA